MKNVQKLIGIIALMAIIGFFFTACSSGGAGNNSGANNNSGSNSSNSGGNLTVTAAIKDLPAELKGIETDFSFFRGESFNEKVDDPLSNYINEPASAILSSSGVVTIKLGTPKPKYFTDADEFFDTFGSYFNVTQSISPKDSKCFSFDEFITSNRYEDGYSLVLGYVIDEEFSFLCANFVYVSKDTTVTAYIEGQLFMDMSLKAGWNYVFINNEGQYNSSTTPPAGYEWIIF
jgi:hypothetical protein